MEKRAEIALEGEASRPVSLAPWAERTSAERARMGVLILDRDAFFRARVRQCLPIESQNASVEADSIAVAMDLMAQNKFECVFIGDLGPDCGWADILEKISPPDLGAASAPLVVVASDIVEKDVLEALRGGAQDYLLKSDVTPQTINVAMVKARESYELKRHSLQTQQQLQQIQRMEAIGQLTSGIAHDFNNLLTVVLGNTRLLRRRIDKDPASLTPEDLGKKIDAIDAAASKGADLVRRLLVFTRQSELSEEMVNINDCVAETFELLKRTLGETIHVEIISEKNPWPISIDKQEFENALINLAVNARDAMPKGGKMTIEISNVRLDETYALDHADVEAGPYVMIAVSDTGCGIDAETMKRVFEPFFTTKEPGKGTGLGLSMVYGFIRQSKGHIHAYSEVGHGTVFRIYLPKARTDEDEETASSGTGEAPAGQETILVVEDDETVRYMAAKMLESAGYRVYLASTGREAFDIIRARYREIDLVFTDIVMPGGVSGIDLVKRMRDYYPHIKALYTSGYTPNAIPDYQLGVGEELISKPYRRDQLAQKIRKVLDGKATV